VMFVRRSGLKGAILATTLDADHHATVAVPGGDPEAQSTASPHAQRLVQNVIQWALQESLGLGCLRWIWMRARRLAGWLAFRAVRFVILAVPLSLAGYLLFEELQRRNAHNGQPQPEPSLVVLTVAIGAIASALTILGYLGRLSTRISRRD
jgi:hypothetical protein